MLSYQWRQEKDRVACSLHRDQRQVLPQLQFCVMDRPYLDNARERRHQSHMKRALLLLIAVVAPEQMASTESPFMEAMNRAMKQIDDGMISAPMKGDADHDFTSMMIAHHQGAIDMPKVELQFGKDPVLRRLAQEILVDQQSEIDAMQLWLKKNAAQAALKR